MTKQQRYKTYKFRSQKKMSGAYILSILPYYRSYIPAFSDIARPLIVLTKKRASNKIIWPDPCNKTFNELTGSQQITHMIFSWHSKTIYHVRKSFIVWNRCFYISKWARERIVFANKKLSKSQDYATIEKKTYTVFFALKKFKHYLYGTQ